MGSTEARPIRRFDDLLEYFHSGHKGDGVELLGTESEKFGVQTKNGKPVSYDGRTCGILGFFERLLETGEWAPVLDYPGGPIIALERDRPIGKEQISLEPGAQLELSGAPQETVHGVADELAAHLEAIRPVSESCGVRWLSAGYHPLATPDRLPWVPKKRYEIMREYFPSVGTRGLDMMRRTATVQVNFDFSSEEDAMRKLRVGLKASPAAAAIFANSPFAEGAVTGRKSERTEVWLHTDRNRTGLLPMMLGPGASYRDYATWALDIPMYFFKRGGEIVANTGQPFRAFMEDGFEGHHAEMDDWILHLNTLFPEVRLQRTLEFRCIDAQSQARLPAVAGFWAGLIYDPTSLAAADELLASWDVETLEALRPMVAQRGLQAEVGGRSVLPLAQQLMELALAGLARRGRKNAAGEDERVHLTGLAELTAAGRCPADLLLEGIDGVPDLREAILDRTSI
ncbi:MAG: glutamate-cysteine ligase family protein [Polyangiaceae bacterium]